MNLVGSDHKGKEYFEILVTLASLNKVLCVLLSFVIEIVLTQCQKARDCD